MTWFIIIWVADGELIASDGASRHAAYETKYKLAGNVWTEWKKEEVSFIWQCQRLIKSAAKQVMQTFSVRRGEKRHRRASFIRGAQFPLLLFSFSPNFPPAKLSFLLIACVDRNLNENRLHFWEPFGENSHSILPLPPLLFFSLVFFEMHTNWLDVQTEGASDGHWC